jgi:hypothetical protein
MTLHLRHEEWVGVNPDVKETMMKMIVPMTSKNL